MSNIQVYSLHLNHDNIVYQADKRLIISDGLINNIIRVYLAERVDAILTKSL